MSVRLRLRFDDATTFNEEFRKNISKGGAFVSGDEAPELRQIIEVELDLAFRNEQRVFEAEVVHVAPGSGVAVQFLKPADQLRDDLDEFLEAERSARPESESGLDLQREAAAAEPPPELETDETEPPQGLRAFEEASGDSSVGGFWELDGEGLGELLGEDSDGLEMVDAEPTPEPVWADAPAQSDDDTTLVGGPARVSEDPLENIDDRRRSNRAPVRVPIRLDATNFSLEARTRDLSESGVLVSGEASELPIGRQVQLELQHPETGALVEIAGTVARHVEGEGTVVAVGIAFDPSHGQEASLQKFVDEAKRVEALRSAAGISGRIEELGMPNLMQMLCSSSPCGTLTARAGSEEAVFAFEEGAIRYVRLGALCGIKALSRMFGWTEGTFHFHAEVDALTEEDDPIPLTNAILEAARQLDEAGRPGLQEYDPSTRFAVDLEAARAAALTQVEQAVLELAMPGLTLRRIIDVIPETDANVFEAVRSLADQGILTALREA